MGVFYWNEYCTVFIDMWFKMRSIAGSYFISWTCKWPVLYCSVGIHHCAPLCVCVCARVCACACAVSEFVTPKNTLGRGYSSVPSRSQLFVSSPRSIDWLWSSPNPRFSGCWGLSSCGNVDGACSWLFILHLVLRLRLSRAAAWLPDIAVWCAEGQLLHCHTGGWCLVLGVVRLSIEYAWSQLYWMEDDLCL
jgi:hypothetical protein